MLLIFQQSVEEKPNLAVETPNLGVSTIANTNHKGEKNDKWKSGILGVIINQYKRICTIESRKIHPDFGWQSRFHDHKIRNDRSLNNIRQYIEDNPKNWTRDKLK